MKPQFTPVQGIGAVFKDEKGKTWKFTAQGWVSEAESIAKDVRNKGTFEIHPGEEEDVKKLREGGLDDLQIEEVMTKRRRIISNNAQTQEDTVETTDPMANLPQTAHPFNGMTKQEMLRDAYSKGVTDIGELENLEALYDKLVGAQADVTMTEEEFSALSYERQLEVKEQLKQSIVAKAQTLQTQSEREGVMESIGVFDTGQEIIDAIEGGISTGPIAGTVRKGVSVFGVNLFPGTRTFGRTTADEDRFAALINVYTARFIKSLSGVAVSDAEREFLMESLPSETKTEQQNIEGIKAISEYMANRYSPTVGVDLEPLVPKSGNNDPLKIFEGAKVTKDNPLGI